MTKVKFNTDKINVYGPKLDGSWRITLEAGEYERENISELVKLPPMQNYTVEIVKND